jgi:hypothetical protein
MVRNHFELEGEVNLITMNMKFYLKYRQLDEKMKTVYENKMIRK